MRRARIVAAITVPVLGLWWLCVSQPAPAQTAPKVQWIWHGDKTPDFEQFQGTRYFRKIFTINRPIEKPVDEGILDITADDEFTVWVNGKEVGKGSTWKRVYSFDVQKLLKHGPNIIAVEASNTSPGPAGLLVRMSFIPNGMSKFAVGSDDTWVSSKTASNDWQKLDFAATGWTPARVFGDYGKVGPWKGLIWDSGGASDDRFTVPEGFKVELAVRPPDNDRTFSLVNMCFDNKGRLLVSREGGPILVCTEPDAKGVMQKVRPYCTHVKNCQGMCWVKDALLLVGDGPKGTGLYRVRDTKSADQTDTAELLHRFKGGMGEHGPHAIIHGPDDWLYLVIGNHAWAQPGKDFAKNSPLMRWPTGGMGPDQGKPNTTEDVLLPRLNDARGHAANILAPGGTIWRLDHHGKNMSLVAAGFRNHFDAAFNPVGELFTFDSDMEWDEALPWYRAVRVCHCPPGADFVWRTGAANTHDYYVDSLPPLAETGRGSPVGVEMYDHHAFPEKYRGAYFMADWAIGVIFAVHLERAGATYKAKVEKFCQGSPMNVTDLNVGPDGALYFTMGGRGSQGGVYRIVQANAKKRLPPEDIVGQLMEHPQPLAPWSREWFGSVRARDELPGGRGSVGRALANLAKDATTSAFLRIRAVDLLNNFWPDVLPTCLGPMAQDKSPEVRAHAVYYIGVSNPANGRETLTKALTDADAMVRRRACEALIRAGLEPPVDKLWPLLGDPDRFVRHAARLVLERIDPKSWADKIRGEGVSLKAFNAIIALCHVHQADAYAKNISESLDFCTRSLTPADPLYLDYLRTVQMALIHVPSRDKAMETIAARLAMQFPQKDWRVNRELAIILVHCQREGSLTQPVQPKVVDALLKAKDDRMQQIHYAYCLRLLKDGWSAADKQAIADWYDSTKTWTGGHSFTPFLENIFRETLGAFTVEDYKAALAHGELRPQATLVLAQRLQAERRPELLPELDALAQRLTKTKVAHRGPELTQAVEDALARAALGAQTSEAFPYLVRGLTSKNPLLRSESLSSLRKLEKAKPKAEDPAPYRTVLLATRAFQTPKDKWQTIELLRQWTGRTFGAESPQWEPEWKLWSRWFAQTFPKEPLLPFTADAGPGESKHKMSDLVAYLDTNPKTDIARGRIIFEKAQCIRCHKFGKEGEGVGPDLTTLSKRFKRADILDSILYPSKVISDQYRSVTITTTKGQSITGLAAVQGDTVTVLLSDATKVTLKRDEIDTQVASLISVMPERALDPLTLQEIADLIAFMESEPK